PLHPRFHRAAVIKGVVPVGMRGSIHREEEQGAMPDRQALLLKCVADMVSAADADPTLTPKLFTNDGRPDAREMAVRLGFPVKADERDAAWNAYTDGDKD